MKRREILKSIAVLPAAAAALPAQQPAVAPQPTPRVVEETPKIEASVPDAEAEMVPRFFSAEQFAALRKLSDLLMPAVRDTPGALDAHAPEFLDFLIGQSPADRQTLYRHGLSTLNAEAHGRYGKSFTDLNAAEADTILGPLHQPWTYMEPSDPFARFLRAAKQDVMTATVNSREWSTVVSKRSRSAGGLGTYWYPIE